MYSFRLNSFATEMSRRPRFCLASDDLPFPCNLSIAGSARIGSAVAGGRPSTLRDAKPVGEQGSSPAVPSNPNSRLGRLRSPVAQGWDQMDAGIIGIDV